MTTYRTLFLLLFALSQLFSPVSKGQITGRVTDTNRLPLPLVHVVIKGSDRGTQTDQLGKYSILSRRGDTLLFSHLGKHPEEIRVKKSSSVINLVMQADTIKLEEVEVMTKAKSGYKSQKELLKEYPANKNLIKTSWRIIDKDLSSSFFRIIDGKDLAPGPNFLFSIQPFCPSLKVSYGATGIKVALRQFTGKPTPPLFDVDGHMSTAVPTYINATDIDRVAVLEGAAAMSRYGTLGVGGVIVINTKAQTLFDDMGVDRSDKHRNFLDSLMLVSHYEAYLPYEATYLEKLKKARSEKKALDLYESQKERYFKDAYFFLDVYDYYLSRWGYTTNAQALLQDVRKHLPDHVPETKALAYLQQKNGFYESALNLYIQLLLNQSWEGQALRDVANAYAEVGNIKKAWMYYTQYIDIQNQLPDVNFDAYGEDQLITTEMMGILDVYEEPFLNNQDMGIILDEDMRTRLVFEWNKQEANFELQFVTPEGYYDTWQHPSGEKTSEDPLSAKGYCSKQFFLGKENLGLWQVNMNYKGNGSELPTYLKVSIYRNFGLENQAFEVKVFKLSELHEKVQLFTFQQN